MENTEIKCTIVRNYYRNNSDELCFLCEINNKRVYLHPNYSIARGEFEYHDTQIGFGVFNLTQEELAVFKKWYWENSHYFTVLLEITNGFFYYPYPRRTLEQLLKFDLAPEEERKIRNLIKQLTYIYLIKDRRTGYIKIGYSQDPHSRLKQLTKQSTLLPEPNEFEFVFVWEDYANKETTLHRKFADRRKRGEWFNLDEVDIAKIFTTFADDFAMLEIR